jgi:nucleoside transporter
MAQAKEIGFLKIRLGVMMFVNYIVWGAWYVTISTYLTQTLHFTGTQAGAVFSTVSVACLFSPFFIGLVADRYFATERVMAALYALAALLMFILPRATGFPMVYAIMLTFCLCYFPTVALTNSVGMQLVKNPGKEFPALRLMGTIGWIFVGNLIGYLKVEASTTPFLITAIASIVMMFISLFLLPHMPPKDKGRSFNFSRAVGLDALQMLKDKTFLVFAVASILACIPITFYFSFTNDYLNEASVTNAAGKMTLGQVSEVVMMLLMPLVLRWASVRKILIAGLMFWTLRYALLAFGDPGPKLWMFIAAIMLHGVCYDFFLLTGQLYTDQEAPPHLRNTAQGFIFFITYGIGMLLGSLLSGSFVDYFTKQVNGTLIRDWKTFWLTSAAGSFVILIVILLFFRTDEKIRPKEEESEDLAYIESRDLAL